MLLNKGLKKGKCDMTQVEQIQAGYNAEVVRDDWGLTPDTKARLAHDDVEWLADLLNDGDWRVRLEGVRALGLLKGPRSVVHLVRALQDEDSRVSGEARAILRVTWDRLAHPYFCC